jgi:Na+-translocating ferredoxin:NAD+ oxidoreductase RnfG subunit
MTQGFNIRIFLICWGLISGTGLSSADELTTIDQALRQIYPDAAEFKKEIVNLSDQQQQAIAKKAQVSFDGGHMVQLTMYTAYADAQVIGHALEDIVIGKWGPIHYLVGISPQGAVVQTVVLDYQEIRGRPIAKKRFLKQYTGKSINDPLQLKKDIDGITGATISSRSMTDGVRKLLHAFDVIMNR